MQETTTAITTPPETPMVQALRNSRAVFVPADHPNPRAHHFHRAAEMFRLLEQIRARCGGLNNPAALAILARVPEYKSRGHGRHVPVTVHAYRDRSAYMPHQGGGRFAIDRAGVTK